MAKGEFTHEALDKLGNTTPYLDVRKPTAELGDSDVDDEGNKYEILGSVTNITNEANDLELCARAYVKVGNTYYYANNYVIRSMASVAQAALNDPTDPYTTEQRTLLERYLVK